MLDSGNTSTSSEKSHSHAHDSMVGEFLNAFVYGAAEAPARSVAEFTDHLAGTHWDQSVVAGFRSIGFERPDPTNAGTGVYLAQQLGRGLGSMAPYALSFGSVLFARGLLGETNAVRNMLSLGSATTLMGAAQREALLGVGTGLTYGTLFHPADDPNGGSYGHQKLKNLIGDASAFGVMGFSFPYLGKAFGITSGAVENMQFGSPAIRELGSSLLKQEVFPNVSSLLPGNAVGTGIRSLFGGGAPHVAHDDRNANA